MKLKDKKTLLSKTQKELNQELDQLFAKLNSLRLDLKTNKLKDTSQLKKIRYQIALIKTLISQAKLKKDL